MKQDITYTNDIRAYRADGEPDTNNSSSSPNFGVALVDNLGSILAGGGALVSAFNNKRSYTETRETKTVNFNNGTTIAVIIGAAVVIAVVAYALLRK